MTAHSSISFEEAIRQIQELIENEKLSEAHRACLELLRFDQDNIQVIRLKNKIEDLMGRNNRRVIKEELEKMAPLWNEKKYTEILEKLKTLALYIADYPELKKVILKAENAYKIQQNEQKLIQYEQDFQRVKSLLEEKKFPDAMREAEKLRLMNLYDGKIRKLIQDLRQKWIQDEMAKNQFLLNGEKFEDILLYLRHLQSIDPDSKVLERVIDKTKRRYQQYKNEEKREYIYAGLEKTRTLLQMGKYEKSTLAAEEILQIDPGNSEAEKLFQRSRRKTIDLIENEVIMQMKSAQKKLETEQSKNSSNVKKI